MRSPEVGEADCHKTIGFGVGKNLDAIRFILSQSAAILSIAFVNIFRGVWGGGSVLRKYNLYTVNFTFLVYSS